MGTDLLRGIPFAGRSPGRVGCYGFVVMDPFFLTGADRGNGAE